MWCRRWCLHQWLITRITKWDPWLYFPGKSRSISGRLKCTPLGFPILHMCSLYNTLPPLLHCSLYLHSSRRTHHPCGVYIYSECQSETTRGVSRSETKNSSVMKMMISRSRLGIRDVDEVGNRNCAGSWLACCSPAASLSLQCPPTNTSDSLQAQNQHLPYTRYNNFTSSHEKPDYLATITTNENRKMSVGIIKWP